MSIADYIWKLRGIADTLSAAGQVIIDEELVMYILGGLNSEYDPAVINLTSRNADVSQAQFLLQSQEMSIEQWNYVILNSQGPSTNYAIKRGQNSGVQKYPNSNFYHGKGRGTDGRGNGKPIC